MADRKRALGVPERDRKWRSTLTGASYQYADGTWQFCRAATNDWHPVTGDTVYTYAGEYFEEVTIAQ